MADWDIGTIDEDPRISDHWFCQEQYTEQFIQLLKFAAAHSHSPFFEIPCATLRWGTAKGMRKALALRLATQIFGLWQAILADWAGHRAPS
jgi:hypothetical protein